MGSAALFLRRVGLVVGISIAGAGCIDATQFIPLPPSAPHPRLPQNDAYQGSVITGKLQPRFAWDASTAAEASKTVTYELQYSADSTFPAESTVTEQTTETFHQPAAALPVSTTPPVGRRYYWRVRACVAANCSAYSRTWWVNLGRSGKDLNGDGYADVAVGSPGDTTMGPFAGKVYVYFGGPGTTMDSVPVGSLLASDQDDGFGSSVVISPDLNGDGFSDLVVGANYADPLPGPPFTRSGTVSLFYGRAGRTFNGVADVVLGSAFDAERFGEAVSAAGDLNGDGYSDLVVGAPNNRTRSVESGRAFVYFGRQGALSGTTTGILEPHVDGRQFGTRVAGVGDINGDGFADVVVDEMQLGFDVPRRCQSHVYYGGEGILFDGQSDLEIFWPSPTDCQIVTASAGDIDGDGFSDLATFLNRTYPDIQTVHLFRGGLEVAGMQEVPLEKVAISSSTLTSAIGDVNGDGHGDIASLSSPNLEIYYGRPDGTIGTAPVGAVPRADVMSAAGDINGDGFDDLIIGRLYPSRAGSALVYFGGGASSFDPTPDATLTPSSTDDSFGSAVALLTCPLAGQSRPRDAVTARASRPW